MVILVDLAEKQVRAIGANDRYMTWIEPVREAFNSISLVGDLKGFVAPLKNEDSKALERLAFSADWLSQRSSEKPIEDVQLTQIRDGLKELQKEIHASSLNDELKLFLLYQVGVILDAIGQYKLFGLRPLEQATNETIGALVLNRERQQLSEVSAGKKFLQFLHDLAVVVSAARDVTLVLDFLGKLIGRS
jgi:hypothetical protein